MAILHGLYSSGKGYGSAGASVTRRATKGFTAISGSPREDIDFNNYTLRQRGRLMYMGNPVAASGVKTHRTNTIGLGLRLNPRPDAAFLGMSSEEAEEWSRTVKREFSLWADKKRSCDATGINDFYELQQLLLISWLASGDAFVLIQRRPATLLMPYTLRLRAIEADRVATPDRMGYPTLTTGRNEANGNRIYDGIEVDGSGMPVAYHIRNIYPFEATFEKLEFVRIAAEGVQSGLPNVLHIMNTERPEQYRGVSYLAPVIIQLLQLNRYTEAEIMAALIGAFQSGFVTTTAKTSEMPFNEAAPVDATGAEDEVSTDENEYEVGPGTINIMDEGEDIKFVTPTHPNSGFNVFMDSICTQIGAALEIPRDILLKQFNASYSASRGALLEAWKSFRMYRTWFVNDFCNPVYEIWMYEAVATGRIKAPGFLNDPLRRAAYLQAEWIGPSQGMLDPEKEIKAEALACENGFSTHEDSALRLNGSDFNSNVERLKVEHEMMDSAGLLMSEDNMTQEGENDGNDGNDGDDTENPDRTQPDDGDQ